MPRLIDINGCKFGRLTVVGRSDHPKKIWLCECECGNTTQQESAHLRNGQVQSCGCQGRENRKKSKTKHGMHGTTEYRIWADMIQRCCNPKQAYYSDYGGRGIFVCDEWKDFQGFFDSMGFRPNNYHTLDRIDNDGPYAPHNCRWATQTEQNLNQRLRADNTSGKRGVSFHRQSGKYHAYISMYGKMYNLGYFERKDDAIAAREEAERRLL